MNILNYSLLEGNFLVIIIINFLILHIFHFRASFSLQFPGIIRLFSRFEMYFMKFMFILLKNKYLYKNRLIRFIPEYLSFYAANGVRPVVYTLEEIKNIINQLYKTYYPSSEDSYDFLIRPCPCRDAQRKYSKKLPNITDILFVKNMKKYPKTKDNYFINREELFKKLEFFDKIGLVHMVLGCMGVNGAGINICNCHKSVCYVLQAVLGRDIKRGLKKGPSIASVNVDKCKGVDQCGECLKRCVFHARKVIDNKSTVISENCYGCGLCANSCPENATIMIPRENWEPVYFPIEWIRGIT